MSNTGNFIPQKESFGPGQRWQDAEAYKPNEYEIDASAPKRALTPKR